MECDESAHNSDSQQIQSPNRITAADEQMEDHRINVLSDSSATSNEDSHNSSSSGEVSSCSNSSSESVVNSSDECSVNSSVASDGSDSDDELLCLGAEVSKDEAILKVLQRLKKKDQKELCQNCIDCEDCKDKDEIIKKNCDCQKTGVFFEFSIEQQVRYMFEHRDLASAIDQYHRERKMEPDCICDITDGNRKKPDMNTYFKPFVDSLSLIHSKGGIPWTCPVKKVQITSQIVSPVFSLDAPAKAIVLNVKNHNHRFGCNVCEVKAVRVQASQNDQQTGRNRKKKKTSKQKVTVRRFVFTEEEAPIRTDERMFALGELASVRALKPYLPTEYFQHWMLLVVSINILLQDSISDEDLKAAEIMLRCFVRDIAVLYDKRYYTYNSTNVLAIKIQGRESRNSCKASLEICGSKVYETLCHEEKLVLENNNIETFELHERIKIKSQVYTSRHYDKNVRRANSFVYFEDSNNQVRYGEILYFVKDLSSQDMFTLLNLFKIKHTKLFFLEESLYKVRHLLPVDDSGEIIVMPVSCLRAKMTKAGQYLCLRPNPYEVNM
ncbi:Trigger factor [Frankliniella fusca]|uniref:Trigger factor n=1 Tax=Frankliniella fusca TaxID=407009 RepID=A0AAE1LGS2_9NEOP|nr:Trigger factor [Frankliniella fusca]